ncbi:conjugal transfer protein [Gemella sp. GH3]|uniref:conjugal transfer protein n=1 Tax=unclassified Gemella TaxID=2624949 RepID=UPI0015D0BCC0|nr:MULTISPECIES: conjugal transfer protein [unclassified Gemella]MBF0714103.1 conjugal transfer protein [Gemella sp. GH3.1]NYS51055.1 conjugal transfer protein [Gemella sp. GH3]
MKKLIYKIKAFFIGENKEYKKERKLFQKENFRTIDKAKRRNKLIITMVWTIIILILTSSIFLIVKKGVDRIKLNNTAEDVKQIKSEIETSNIYNSKMDNFAKNFTTIYINYNNEKEKERKEQLENYYLKNLKDNVETKSSKLKRELTSIRLYSTEKMDNENYLYTYLISYSLTEEDIKKTRQELINIPIKVIDNNYSVSNYPYFSNVPKDKSNGTYEEKEIKFEKEKDKREELESFTKDFFKKYVSYTEDEIKYLMKTPEVITGKELSNINKIDVYNNDNNYIVYTELSLVDKDIKLSTLEKFTLTITKKDGKYFVEKLEHK